MADILPTTWPVDPHTLAKHAILKRYLEAWFPILTQQAAAIGLQRPSATSQILFIDGFAGPGEYTNGEEGSPVIALKAALNHRTFPLPVRMLFIEERKDRFDHLQKVLAPHLARANKSSNILEVDPRRGDCNTMLNSILDDCQRTGVRFGPALAFLDQFGYGDVSMDLIARILKFPQCEVFSYLDYKGMNRWIDDPNKASAFTRAYGGDDWRGVSSHVAERERRTFLRDRYKAALKDPKRGGATYVTCFSMFDRNGQPLYWLFFCTNNLRGLEEMKRAMWAVDKTGEFRFSDQDNPSQLLLFEEAYNQAWLADELVSKLAGQTVTAYKAKEYVLTDTPCYLFKKALKSLEVGKQKRAAVVKQPPGRKPGTYPDDHLNEIELAFSAAESTLPFTG